MHDFLCAPSTASVRISLDCFTHVAHNDEGRSVIGQQKLPELNSAVVQTPSEQNLGRVEQGARSWKQTCTGGGEGRSEGGLGRGEQGARSWKQTCT